MGNGEDTLFWEEIWRGDTVFMFRYLRVFMLESNKKILVVEKLAHVHLICSLCRILRDGVENAQFTELAASLEGFHLL